MVPEKDSSVFLTGTGHALLRRVAVVPRAFQAPFGKGGWGICRKNEIPLYPPFKKGEEMEKEGR